MLEDKDGRLLNHVEHLKNQEIDPTDGAELQLYAPCLAHCVFCFDTVKNSLYDRWYIPLDKSCCICEKCFNDFKDMFGWSLLDGWDIEWPCK